MTASAKPSQQLRINERQRGVVTAVNGNSVSVSSNGSVKTYQASGFLIGDEVIVNGLSLVRVPGVVDVVEV